MARFLATVVAAVVAAAAVAVQAAPVQAQRANITAYLIAHSHQDAGWLKTIDQYYEEVPAPACRRRWRACTPGRAWLTGSAATPGC